MTDALMTAEPRRTRQVTRSGWHAGIAVGCLVFSAVVCWINVVLVVFGHVVSAWAVSMALLCAALVSMRVAAVRRRAMADADAAPRRRVWMQVLRGLLVAAAAIGSALGAAGDVSAEYHVLQPEGPNGCLAIVRESSFLSAGRGEVYTVSTAGPVGIVGWPSGSWTADDGYRPIAQGTYELRWGRSDGALTVSGSEVNPVMDGVHSLKCN